MMKEEKYKPTCYKLTRLILCLVCLFSLFGFPKAQAAAESTQVDIVGPAGSQYFGNNVRTLENGNILVIDYMYDDGATADVGAVYLYDGKTYALISMLKGSHANDHVGYSTSQLVGSDYILILSPDWGNNDEGAITFCSFQTGCSGVVSSANSLVGSNAGDALGSKFGTTFLSNNDYVIYTPQWGVNDVGAVTYCSGVTGCNAVISSSNSLVGSNASDQISSGGVHELRNGAYVVRSPNWGTNDEGAVTWCSAAGCTGTVSSSNSLVGSNASDKLGSNLTMLYSNSNYVVTAWDWGTNNEGAVTWCSGATGCKDTISSANSLVGSPDNKVGNGGIIPLLNGNYVVRSTEWDNGSTTNVGAATFCNGAAGCTGAVSSSNSLVGSLTNDYVSNIGIVGLPNSSYVVISHVWGPNDEGAVTWCNATTGCTGTISSSNSLVGSSSSDFVGSTGIVTLNNGNYVVKSPMWGASNYGAATWCSGTTGCKGVVSDANSMVGSNSNDKVSGGDIYTLANGGYLIRSNEWGANNEGAVTWCNGTAVCAGTVSSSNSLVGSHASDWVGNWYTTELPNGSFLVRSPYWDLDASHTNVGAVTWCSGVSTCAGVISSSNSLVGSLGADWVGYEAPLVLSNGNYVLRTPAWGANDEGAVTWCSGSTGCKGTISATNSLVGSSSADGVGGKPSIQLPNGNYLVPSPVWGANDVGAITWCSGATGCKGTISAANSLVGVNTNDKVSSGGALFGIGVKTLLNGGYIISSPNWGANDEGAVTWCDATGCVGNISPVNSLVGTNLSDQVGDILISTFSDGNYAVLSSLWGLNDQGAVTLGAGFTGTFGPLTSSNSVIGIAASGGAYLDYSYYEPYCRLTVLRPSDLTISFITASTCLDQKVFAPLVRK